MQNKQQVIDFLTHLKGSSVMQISTLNTPTKFSEVDGQPNIYLCGGLKNTMGKRCEDDDIGLKRYCFVDIDIRNDYFLKHGEVITQEQLRVISAEIVARIELKGYSDYCALVDSGNGLHIYWTGKERTFDKDVYSNGVRQLQSIINHIISDLGYVCDPACTNLSRISRLPGTINPRKKDTKSIQYDLGPIEAEILRFEPKDSETFDSLELMSDLYKEQAEKERKELLEAKRFIKDNHKKKDGEDIRQEINSIPVGDIAEYVWGVKQTHDDGEVITLKEPHKNMGAYVYKPFNIVYNQGSSLVKTDRKTFTPFELVCFELMNGDRPNTLKWFKDKYNIETEKKEVIIPKKEYTKQGYLFPDDIFDSTFDCVMSGELVTIVAESNSGKTTFAMDMLQRNLDRGKKCLYVNLEFGIDQVATNNRLFMNGKRKRNITDIDPLTGEEQKQLDAYIKKYLSRFDYINKPGGMSLEELLTTLVAKSDEGYSLVVLDTFAMVEGNADDKAYTNQNKCMQKLQELVQNTGMTIVQLHHTNKNGTMEGSQKILNLSNTLITIRMCIDDYDDTEYSEATLTKDKFTKKVVVKFKRQNRKRVLYTN